MEGIAIRIAVSPLSSQDSRKTYGALVAFTEHELAVMNGPARQLRLHGAVLRAFISAYEEYTEQETD